MNRCNCFFCNQGMEHTGTHKEYRPTSPRLLKSGNLKRADMVPMEYCILCGHKRSVQDSSDKPTPMLPVKPGGR